MCSYVVPQEVDALARRTRNNNESTCNDGHFPVAVESNKQVGCAVCMLEYRWKKQELKMGGGGGVVCDSRTLGDASSVGLRPTRWLANTNENKAGKSTTGLSFRTRRASKSYTHQQEKRFLWRQTRGLGTHTR